MILASTTSQIEGHRLVAPKGIAQGASFEDMLRHAEALGANAIVNAKYDGAIAGESVFHGDAAVVEPIPKPLDIGK